MASFLIKRQSVTKLGFLNLIYNGHIAIVNGSTWAPNPMKTAWTLCTLSTVLYALTIYSIVSYFAESFIAALNISERIIQLVIIIVVVVLSDLRGSDYWFGAGPIDLGPGMVQKAKNLALAFSAGSYVVFMVVNILLFAKF